MVERRIWGVGKKFAESGRVQVVDKRRWRKEQEKMRD